MVRKESLLYNPQLRASLFKEARATGISLEEYITKELNDKTTIST